MEIQVYIKVKFRVGMITLGTVERTFRQPLPPALGLLSPATLLSVSEKGLTLLVGIGKPAMPVFTADPRKGA